MPKRSAPKKRVAAAAQGAAQSRQRKNFMWYGGLGGAGVVVAIIIVVSVVLGGGNGAPSHGNTLASAGSGSTVAVSDDAAPLFDFSLYQGEQELGAVGLDSLDLTHLRGKPVVLNFWAGLCPPCRAEMPDLQRFHDEFNDEVTLIGVDIGKFMRLGSQRDAERLLAELNISYPAGFTNDGGVVRDYRITGMPTTVFIDSKGEIFQNWPGIVDESTLGRFAEAMLKADADAETDPGIDVGAGAGTAPAS